MTVERKYVLVSFHFALLKMNKMCFNAILRLRITIKMILVNQKVNFVLLIVAKTSLRLLMCLFLNAKINYSRKHLRKSGQRILNFLEKTTKDLRTCAYYFVCWYYGWISINLQILLWNSTKKKKRKMIILVNNRRNN